MNDALIANLIIDKENYKMITITMEIVFTDKQYCESKSQSIILILAVLNNNDIMHACPNW